MKLAISVPISKLIFRIKLNLTFQFTENTDYNSTIFTWDKRKQLCRRMPHKCQLCILSCHGNSDILFARVHWWVHRNHGNNFSLTAKRFEVVNGINKRIKLREEDGALVKRVHFFTLIIKAGVTILMQQPTHLMTSLCQTQDRSVQEGSMWWQGDFFFLWTSNLTGAIRQCTQLINVIPLPDNTTGFLLCAVWRVRARHSDLLLGFSHSEGLDEKSTRVIFRKYSIWIIYTVYIYCFG